MPSMSRRNFGWLAAAMVVAAGIWLSSTPTWAQPAAKRGGTLTYVVFPEPPLLTSAVHTAGPTAQVSPKMFDGLVTYDFDFNLKPQLALSWQVGDDGKSIRFNLRPGVKWHDGKDFTSADVAYSLLKVWKVAHGRGRATFANVTDVLTPDANTAILQLSSPAPYIMYALASMESQIVPKHIYDGTDPQTNAAARPPASGMMRKMIRSRYGLGWSQ